MPRIRADRVALARHRVCGKAILYKLGRSLDKCRSAIDYYAAPPPRKGALMFLPIGPVVHGARDVSLRRRSRGGFVRRLGSSDVASRSVAHVLWRSSAGWRGTGAGRLVATKFAGDGEAFTACYARSRNRALHGTGRQRLDVIRLQAGPDASATPMPLLTAPIMRAFRIPTCWVAWAATLAASDARQSAQVTGLETACASGVRAPLDHARAETLPRADGRLAERMAGERATRRLSA